MSDPRNLNNLSPLVIRESVKLIQLKLLFADDEPDDGPEHYIFVSGFYHPHLVPLLSDIGVNVDAMIKVMSDNYEVLQTQPDPSADPAEPPTEEKLQGDYQTDQFSEGVVRNRHICLSLLFSYIYTGN